MTALKSIPVATLLSLPDNAIRLALALADAADADGCVTLAAPKRGKFVAGLSRAAFHKAMISLTSIGIASHDKGEWVLGWVSAQPAATSAPASAPLDARVEELAALVHGLSVVVGTAVSNATSAHKLAAFVAGRTESLEIQIDVLASMLRKLDKAGVVCEPEVTP